LLVRIRNPQDAEAWEQFVEIYAPLVYRYARRHKLQDADAADLTQDVLRSVAGAVGRLHYDRRRGSFRSWLFTVARNKLINFVTRERRRPRGGGGSDFLQVLENQPARDDSEADQWEREYEQRLFAWAAEKVRHSFQEATWQAFWRTAVEGESVRAVAAALKMTEGAVYIARSRVTAQLRKQVQEIGDRDSGLLERPAAGRAKASAGPGA
jgi:RNA polymerase sigma-70 factor (ECF subfamily)